MSHIAGLFSARKLLSIIRILTPQESRLREEIVLRSKKTRFLRFFVKRCLTNSYTDPNL